MDCPTLPTESLIGGNAASFGRDGLAFFEACERLGPIVRFRVYHRRAYIVTGPDLIEEVLVKRAKSFNKPRLLKGMHMLFGDGLLTADGDGWRHRRRTLQPVFHSRKTREYAPIVERNARRMLARFTDGERYDFHEAAIDMCVRNLTEALFSSSDEELNLSVLELAALCQEMVQRVVTYDFPYYAVFPPLFRMRFRARLRMLEAKMMRCLDRVRGPGNACPAGETAAPDDFYGRLTRSQDVDGCPMSARGIRDEVVTMLLAGHETAAAALSWALLLLWQHPKELRRLQEELDGVCGDRLPTFDDLERLPLLDRVLLETYRLYPPTHRIGRTAMERVEVGGVTIEPGEELGIPQWAVHRSPRHYEAPLEFRPDRWLSDAADRLPRYAYFPFSGGPRVCIGQSMVVMEDALALGAFVKTFDFALEGGAPRPVEGLTLLPGHPSKLMLRLHRRSPTLTSSSSSSMPASPLSSRRMLRLADDISDDFDPKS
jgi:cytochrome P450